MQDYFPLDIAFDEAFIGRTAELVRVKSNIELNTHTLITSPRRYGKTSLVMRIFSEVDAIGTPIDMMVASNAERMQSVIMEGVSHATSAMASGRRRVIQLIKKIFEPFSAIEIGGMTLKFHPYLIKAPHLVVLDALDKLEQLAGELNHKVVLFFDEYQHVLSISGVIDFEASLRSFAQRAKHIVCIFSGSNRHVLQRMFSDSSRPFYNMCDHLLLSRISTEVYQQHLASLAKKSWRKVLDPVVIDAILSVTRRHPYFVNALCRRLWASRALPTVTKVLNEWKTLARERRYEISHDFEGLSPIQRTILIELSQSPFTHPTSKEVVKRLNASLSGITNAMTGLLDRDYIYQDAAGLYRVLNPLMEYMLRQSIPEYVK